MYAHLPCGTSREEYCLDFVHCQFRSQYERITSSLSDALDFTNTIGAGDGQPYESGGDRGVLAEVDFFTR